MATTAETETVADALRGSASGGRGRRAREIRHDAGLDTATATEALMTLQDDGRAASKARRWSATDAT